MKHAARTRTKQILALTISCLLALTITPPSTGGGGLIPIEGACNEAPAPYAIEHVSGDAALQQSGYNEGGSGTESDPYQLRIPNCHDSAIRIENTTAHATIRSGEIWLTHGYAFEIHNNTGTITLTDTRITPAMTLFNASTSNLALRHDNHPPRIGGAIGNAHDSTLTIAGYT